MADTIDHELMLGVAIAYDDEEGDFGHLARAYLDLRRRLDEALAEPSEDEQTIGDINGGDLSAFVEARKSRLAIKEGG